MSNDVFDCLFRERVDIFRAAFSSVSTEAFYDPETRKLRHAGEYGMYRESIVRDFLKFVIPRSLDISTGFCITSMNDVSTQCDIVAFDSRMTPLYEQGDRQRFFPVESVFCVGEVKSTLSRSQFRDALRRLAAIKQLGERITSPALLRPRPEGVFDPTKNPYDLVPSVLICQKLGFDLSNIENELDELYGIDIAHRHKHNMILSVEDGLFAYADPDGSTLPYSRIGEDFKHRFTFPAENKYIHFNLFGSYLFMVTTGKTLLYPEFTNYLGNLSGGYRRDQR